MNDKSLMSTPIQYRVSLEKLRQGYSYTVNEEGKNVRDASQVRPGEELTVYVTNGRILTQVKERILLEGILGENPQL